MKREKFILAITAVLLMVAIPTFSNSSRHYYAYTTTDSPVGSGYIYVKRGGQADQLLLTISSDQWVPAGSTFDAGTISMGQNSDPDGYKVYDPSKNNNKSEGALHMYFYAKPNPGYQFEGWFKEAAGTTPAESSTDHYPLPNPKPSTKTSYTPSRWDNGGTNDQLPSQGAWQDFYFLRYVEIVTGGNDNVNRYARFSLIARPFVLMGTGFEDVSYTAGSYNVGASNVTTSNLTNDIELSISYEASKYVFSGWQWSEGINGTKYDFAGTANATYVLNNTSAGRGLTSDTRVYIWPNIKEKAAGIDVIYNDETTSYETWEEALSAAKAEGVNGATIRLKKDVSEIAVAQAIDRSMTIDLNGRTLSGTANNLFTISGSGTNVTITDGTLSQVGRLELNIADVATTYAVTVKSGAQLTIAGGTIYSNNTKSDGTARGVEVQSGTILNMVGGIVEAQSLQNAYAVINRGTATINGGTLYAHTTTAATAVGFYNVGTSATVNGGSFLASSATTTAYGIQQNVNNTLTINNAIVQANAATSTAYALTRSNGVIVVNDGKYNAVASSTVASVNVANKAQITLKGGVYRTHNNVRQCAATGYDCYELEGGADYDAGYRFQVTAADAHPHVCKVIEIGKTTYYESLEDALAYANNNPNTLMSIIMMVFEYTLPAGNYTIPNQASLIVPKNVDQTGASLSVDRVDSYVNPSLFRKLTFANGVHMDVFGTIEVGGTQNSNGQGVNGAGIPSGAFGQLVLESGSNVILNNGARMNAWGFVTGAGEIDARRGSQVYEQFQMFDWKGGKNAGGMLNNSKKVFPVNQYYIQNIESPTTFHPGSALTAMTSIYVSDTRINCDAVKIVGVTGSGAMFLMDDEDDSDDTWVRKSYDVANDKQVYAVNSSAHLGSIVLELAGVPIIGDLNFDSRNYTLPLTSNMKIHLLDGHMDVTQSTVMIPGSEIEIDKTSTVIINSGQSLYLYDAEEWGLYVFSGVYAQQVRYVPDYNDKPNKRPEAGSKEIKPASASINVHGTFDVQGALYTTASGANIFSTNEDAGTVYFAKNAPADGSVSQPVSYTDGTITNTPVYEDRTCTSAKLKNEEGYTTTKGIAKAGDSYCYIQDAWRNLQTDECFVYETTEEGTIYYAKPADYVALANGKTENNDHTYSSADGTRTFILITNEEGGDCQWWEVVYHLESGLYYCEKNDTYYFYDEEVNEWQVQRYTVYWNDWEGSPIMDGLDVVTYWLPYGVTPKYLGSTPTRAKDDYYTYDFIGWSPEFAPLTADVTYTAQYERKDRMYTITWKDELNNTIETDYCKMGQIPVCYNEPNMTGKEWSPAVSAVTGDITYTLQTKEEKANYTITWKNWDGTTLHTSTPAAGTAAADVLAGYSEPTPTKPALTDIEFVFAAWSPAVADATADAVYTATFTEQLITYTILWKNYDGSILETDENVTPNTVPQYTGATPTKPSDETYNYAFSGWTPEIVAATEDAVYTATYAATPKDKSVSTAETMEGGTQQTVTNLTITSTGQLTIPSTSRINAENLILEGTNTTSGQLITNSNTSINVTGEAYFDWTPNGANGTQYRTWYAVAVPWEVNAETGIFIKGGRHLVLGSDFDLVWYDGEERAANGDGFNCWKYVEYETDKIMHPGKSYMMYFGPTGIQTIRFAKASGSAVIYNSPINVETYDLGTGVTTDANWNGIANPRTYYVSLGTGASFAQVLGNGSLDAYFANPEAPVYTTIDVDASKFIVGQPLFVQAVNPQPVVVTKETSAGIVNAAPRRARTNNLPDDIAARYAVHIALDGHASTDNLFIQVTEEEKEDAYVLGQDLSKGGVAKTLPQLWVNRYNAKLSVNTQSLTNDVAEYPLTIFAPKTGEYVINTENIYDDYDLYLTMNGVAVWNLSNGEYTFSLPQGNMTEYGLRVSAKSPAVATGVDEALVDAQGDTKKVLINDQVFIIRGENVYTIDGQLVK